MTENRSLEILKEAILLEKRGRAFYRKVADQTKSDSIREVFATMAEEEQKHIEYLSQQYISIEREGQFEPLNMDTVSDEIARAVLSPEIRQEISAAGFEAAAITAAMAMEERAAGYYAEQARTSGDPTEKDLYERLADWEKTHFKVLYEIDQELRESVWHDSKFWPVI